jgi:hypothetical protein
MNLKNGYNHVKNGWKYIYIEGNPYDRGYAYGSAIVDDFKEIQKMLEFYIYESYGYKWEYLVTKINKDIDKFFSYDKTYRELKQEIEGIVDGINKNGGKTTIQELVAWNYYYSIPYWINTLNNNSSANINNKEGGASDKCSTIMAVGKDWTSDGEIVCAHNTFTEFIDGQYAYCILQINPIHGNEIIFQTTPGQIFSGTDFWISSAGFIGTESTLGGFYAFKLNVPIFLRCRKMMQYANTLDEHVEYLNKGNSGGYANAWLIGDLNKNEIMRLELGLKYINVNKTKNGYFFGFNAAFDPRIRNIESNNSGFYDIRRHQGARNVRLYDLMEKHKGKINIPIAKEIISDHYDVYLKKKKNPCSRTVCSHYDLDDRKYMSQDGRPVPFNLSGAVDGIVTDSKLARKMQMVCKFGSSCNIGFNAKSFFNKHHQWRFFKDYIKDRPVQPWTLLGKDIKSGNHKTKNNKNKKNNKTKKN